MAEPVNNEMEFYERIAGYINRHPEFVEELQRRMKAEEQSESSYKDDAHLNNDYSNASEAKSDGKKKGFMQLDEEKINRISDELSGMLFEKDALNKSALEIALQEAFCGLVKNYLSKYS